MTYRRWPTEEDRRLVELLEAHWSYRRIGQMLNRSESSVGCHASNLGLSVRTCNGRTLTGTAKVMGVTYHVIVRWVSNFGLKAHCTGRRAGQGMPRIIEHDDLTDWMEDERHWFLWQPAAITDKALREWAEELREGVEFITTAEAARRLYVTQSYVQSLVNLGKLPAVRNNHTLIRSDQLKLPTPQRHRCGEKYTPEEVKFILTWYGKRPTTWIARQLKRTGNEAIVRVALRHGRERLGCQYWHEQRRQEKQEKVG